MQGDGMAGCHSFTWVKMTSRTVPNHHASGGSTKLILFLSQIAAAAAVATKDLKGLWVRAIIFHVISGPCVLLYVSFKDPVNWSGVSEGKNQGRPTTLA